MRLAFSLPVHENNQIIDNQVKNIFRFNPGCIIVLHVSKIFKDFDRSYFDKIDSLYINDSRLMTEHGKGLMACHCSCFNFLVVNNISFDIFCLISSNEMFIKTGLVNYVSHVKNGFQAVRFNLIDDWHIFLKRIDKHPKVQKMLNVLNVSEIYGGQAEGQFFEKKIFQKITNVYYNSFGKNDLNDFETEEIVPQTIAIALGLKPCLPFTLVDYTHNLDFKLNKNFLRKLVDRRMIGQIKLNLGRKGKNLLISPHYLEFNYSIFSVKRVPRDVNNSLRLFINAIEEEPHSSQQSFFISRNLISNLFQKKVFKIIHSNLKLFIIRCINKIRFLLVRNKKFKF
jgi:hypothetical protein